MRKTYTIAGREFYQDELVYGQLRFLRDKLRKYDIQNLTLDSILDIMTGDIAGLLAVILIPSDKSQQQKVRDGAAGVQELEEWFSENMRPAEAQQVMPDFFALNPVEAMTLGFQKFSKADQGGIGSIPQLFSLPTETSPS